jgi:outer membrane biosynthesis protein TonB
MFRARLYSVCGIALLIWGCQKRPTTSRVVYVPAPPPAAAPGSSQDRGTLVIEEPQPPEEITEPTPPAEAPEPKPARRRPRPARSDAAPSSAETPPEPEQPTSTEVPALEAREAPAQQAALRQQIVGLQQDLHRRTGQLEHRSLSAADRKTLEDARTFLTQSEHALADGDLQRALNLAQKASLLVSALDQQLNR